MSEFLPYKEFKTVMEMIYIIEKAHAMEDRWTETDRQIFEENFVKNLLQMQKNKKFQKEYALYEVAAAQKQIIIPPKNAYQEKLNKILREIENIKLACKPYQLDNKEVLLKQAGTRLKYEKRLRNKELYAKFLANKKKVK